MERKGQRLFHPATCFLVARGSCPSSPRPEPPTSPGTSPHRHQRALQDLRRSPDPTHIWACPGAGSLFSQTLAVCDRIIFPARDVRSLGAVRDDARVQHCNCTKIHALLAHGVCGGGVELNGLRRLIWRSGPLLAASWLAHWPSQSVPGSKVKWELHHL